MISQRATDSFDQMLVLGIKASMGSASSEDCVIEVLPKPQDIQETQVVMLTVASYVFRLLVLVYFSPDEATKAHFADITHVDPSEMNEQAFLDVIRECGNICCGTLNRELVRVFPHVGMSTPNIIERECVSYLEALQGGHLQHFRATKTTGQNFYFGICVRDFANIDFEWAPAEEVVEAGEMEFF
jgi:hypothetical protein